MTDPLTQKPLRYTCCVQHDDTAEHIYDPLGEWMRWVDVQHLLEQQHADEKTPAEVIREKRRASPSPAKFTTTELRSLLKSVPGGYCADSDLEAIMAFLSWVDAVMPADETAASFEPIPMNKLTPEQVEKGREHLAAMTAEKTSYCDQPDCQYRYTRRHAHR